MPFTRVRPDTQHRPAHEIDVTRLSIKETADIINHCRGQPVVVHSGRYRWTFLASSQDPECQSSHVLLQTY